MPERLLIVEDDDAMARLLRDNLVYEGYSVDRSGTAVDVQDKLRTFNPQLVLLDLMLPDRDGFEICRELAITRDRPPIIILSARSAKADMVRGLNLGADDYLTKPFAFEELLARIRAVLRRHSSANHVLTLGEVIVDFRARRATRDGRDIGISQKELEILHYLADRKGKLVTRDDLLHEVWGYRDVPLTRAVDISIARLRRKIEVDPHHPRYLCTIHGDGYSLTPDG